MEITPDGWFTWMQRDPGPPARVNGGRNTLKGVVIHSAEGNTYEQIRAVLFGDRGSSWLFTNLKDGRCYQHYPVYAQTWTSGNGYMNNNCAAWENEGKAGQPFTDAQNQNNIRVIRTVRELGKWNDTRRPKAAGDLAAQLWEHNEGVRFGGMGTACPSGRVPWQLYLDALNEEDDEMKPIRIWCAERSKTYLLGPFGAVEVKTPADDKELEKLYGGHAAVLTGAQVDALLAT